MWGLLYCTGFFLIVASRDPFPAVTLGLLTGVSSLAAEQRLQSLRSSVACGSRALEHRLSGCGAWAQLLRYTWDLPRSGREPVFPALAGDFFFYPQTTREALLATSSPPYLILLHLICARGASSQGCLKPYGTFCIGRQRDNKINIFSLWDHMGFTRFQQLFPASWRNFIKSTFL